MVDYTVINGTNSQLVNVNGGGTDVDAFTYKEGVTLTNAELAALLTTAGVAAMADAATAQEKRVVAVASAYLSA